MTLEPNETRTYGLAFIVAPSIREIEDTLISIGHPVAAGVPGFIIESAQKIPVVRYVEVFLRIRYPYSLINTEWIMIAHKTPTSNVWRCRCIPSEQSKADTPIWS